MMFEKLRCQLGFHQWPDDDAMEMMNILADESYMARLYPKRRCMRENCNRLEQYHPPHYDASGYYAVLEPGIEKFNLSYLLQSFFFIAFLVSVVLTFIVMNMRT